MTNGDGLFRQMGETKERLAAWLSRGLIIVLLTTVGYLVTTTWNDLKAKLDDNTKSTWLAIGQTNKTVSDLAQTVTGLSTTLNDHIRDTEKREDDHETRIRLLEKTGR